MAFRGWDSILVLSNGQIRRFIPRDSLPKDSLQKRDHGLTLIELVIVMLMASTLALIGLPSLISQSGKARNSEAKTALSALASAQQVHFIQEGNFANNIDNLSVTVNTQYFTFPEPSISGTGLEVKQSATGINSGGNATRNYSMGVYYVTGRFRLILCESNQIGGMAEAPNTQDGSCVNGSKLD